MGSSGRPCNGRYGDTWPMFGEATENVLWQTSGMAVRGNDHVIQRNAGASEEMAATAEELSSQADMMADSIAFFNLGQQQGNRAPRKPAKKAHTAKSPQVAHSPQRPAKALPAPRQKAAGINLKMASSDDQFESF